MPSGKGLSKWWTGCTGGHSCSCTGSFKLPSLAHATMRAALTVLLKSAHSEFWPVMLRLQLLHCPASQPVLQVAALTFCCSSCRSGVKPNVRTYTALVTALGNAQQWDRALKLLRGMKQPHGSSIEPNAYTYSALIKALGEQVCVRLLNVKNYPLCLTYFLRRPVIMIRRAWCSFPVPG